MSFLGAIPQPPKPLTNRLRARGRRRRVVTDAVAEPSICVWCSFADTDVRSSRAGLNAPRSRALADQLWKEKNPSLLRGCALLTREAIYGFGRSPRLLAIAAAGYGPAQFNRRHEHECHPQAQ